MIFTLSDTDTHEIARTLVEIRDDGSQGTTSRVLTLIAVAKDTDNIRSVISASKDASREHPCRVIVLVTGDPDRNTRIDAEVRIGGDAAFGACGDSPIVAGYADCGVVAVYGAGESG